MPETSSGARMIALVGPGGTGKTSLAEALLFASGATTRQGSVDAGTSIGDSSAEARARHGSTEINLTNLDFLRDRFALIDCPGPAGFSADGYLGLATADLAILVIDPDPDRALLAEPTLRQLEELGIPRAIFVNKIDQARGSIATLLEALQPMSNAPLIARQIPIREGEKISGFIDLALERAFRYQAGKPSERIEIPASLADREAIDRLHMLEQIADHDDVLLEQLLMDESPEAATVLTDLAKETQQSLGVSVFFGSALHCFGVRRLLKAIRHEAPSPAMTAQRLGASGTSAMVFKISHAGALGRVALTRLFGGSLKEGIELNATGGTTLRTGSMFAIQGDKTDKVGSASAGEVVALAKAEMVQPGDWITSERNAPERIQVSWPTSNYSVAISTKDRKDDVRLSAALQKLTEEDPALNWSQVEAHHETRLTGVNDEHLKIAISRLKRRFGVAVDTRQPQIGYKESIRKQVTQRGRHKKQSGGHGQFGDVLIEVAPLERGAGFRFSERIHGGAVPRQYIPAVEQGVQDALARGPLGFPVVDVSVTLLDGSYHSVDSSELAFRTAGRIAMAEALGSASPHLLEPVHHVSIFTPGSFTSRVTSAVASRRGQMLGLDTRQGWSRWDQVDALIPEAELHGLEAELRSLTQGLASYTSRFDHLAELNGRLATEVVDQVLEPA